LYLRLFVNVFDGTAQDFIRRFSHFVSSSSFFQPSPASFLAQEAHFEKLHGHDSVLDLNE
jgi:hypothetical protein